MVVFICRDENIGSEDLIFRCLKKYAEIKGLFYEPGKVKIARNENGKPYFENSAESFSSDENDNKWQNPDGELYNENRKQQNENGKIYNENNKLYNENDNKRQNENGKPYNESDRLSFENHGVNFSLSHTIGLKIVAMSFYNVGADAELIRKIERRERIAERFFTRGEFMRVKTARDFFLTWAAKEAYSKYTSFGIASFKKFDVRKLNDVFVKKLDVGRKYAAYCVSIDREIEYCEIT
jgi:phosphopantetheine--protein transferase-like protein